MGIQALRNHAMAVAAASCVSRLATALASRASVGGRDYTQALPVALLNKFWSSPSHKSGRDRSGRDRRSKHPPGRRVATPIGAFDLKPMMAPDLDFESAATVTGRAGRARADSGHVAAYPA